MMQRRSSWRRLGLTVLLALGAAACSPGVQGKIFFDANQNGLMDTSESSTGMAGVPVELYSVVTTTKKAAKKTKKSAAKSAVTTNATLLGSKAVGVAKDTPADEDSSSDPDTPETPDETDPAPVPSKDETPVVTTVPAATGTLVASATTDRYGHFEFYGMGAGEYEVRVTNAYGPLTLGYRVTSQQNPVSVRSVMSPAKANLGIYRQGLRVVGNTCAETLTAAKTGECAVTLRNESPVTMRNVAVTVIVPRELLVTPGAGGSYYAGTNEVQWRWKEIAPQATVQAGMALVPNMALSTDGIAVALEWRVGSESQLVEESLAGTPPAALAISLAPEIQLSLQAPTIVVPGAPFTVELMHRYQQAVPIPHAALTLTLPDGITVINAAHGTWDADAKTVQWELGTLQPGSQQSYYVQVQAHGPLTAEVVQTLKAELNAMGLDVPKTASAQVLVRADVAVALTVQLMQDVVTAKQDGTVPPGEWHIAVTQAGKRVITGATLVAIYDADMLITGTGNLDSGARTMTWQLPPLQPGVAQQFVLQGRPMNSSNTGLSAHPMIFRLTIPGQDTPIEQHADLQVEITD